MSMYLCVGMSSNCRLANSHIVLCTAVHWQRTSHLSHMYTNTFPNQLQNIYFKLTIYSTAWQNHRLPILAFQPTTIAVVLSNLMRGWLEQILRLKVIHEDSDAKPKSALKLCVTPSLSLSLSYLFSSHLIRGLFRLRWKERLKSVIFSFFCFEKKVLERKFVFITMRNLFTYYFFTKKMIIMPYNFFLTWEKINTKLVFFPIVLFFIFSLSKHTLKK